MWSQLYVSAYKLGPLYLSVKLVCLLSDSNEYSPAHKEPARHTVTRVEQASWTKTKLTYLEILNKVITILVGDSIGRYCFVVDHFQHD